MDQPGFFAVVPLEYQVQELSAAFLGGYQDEDGAEGLWACERLRSRPSVVKALMYT